MASMECQNLALLIFGLNFIVAAFAAGQSNGVCISPGGRFPPFLSEGKPPGKVSKGHKDLVLCRVFRDNTCCDVTQTYPALLLIRRLASAGEGSQECLHLWEMLECSICHPHIGVVPGPPVICASFCDMVYEACLSAYFSIDPKTQVLSPCGFSDTICGRATRWASNGTELCKLAGFSVQPAKINGEDLDESFCYGGKDSLESIADSWRSSKFSSSSTTPSSWVFEDFQQWMGEISTSEKVSWAVGGMVLTAGLLLISKRKGYNRRQKQAAINNTARKIGARISQQSSAKVK